MKTLRHNRHARNRAEAQMAMLSASGRACANELLGRMAFLRERIRLIEVDYFALLESLLRVGLIAHWMHGRHRRSGKVIEMIGQRLLIQPQPRGTAIWRHAYRILEFVAP